MPSFCRPLLTVCSIACEVQPCDRDCHCCVVVGTHVIDCHEVGSHLSWSGRLVRQSQLGNPCVTRLTRRILVSRVTAPLLLQPTHPTLQSMFSPVQWRSGQRMLHLPSACTNALCMFTAQFCNVQCIEVSCTAQIAF